jgi:hypothetical protein
MNQQHGFFDEQDRLKQLSRQTGAFNEGGVAGV